MVEIPLPLGIGLLAMLLAGLAVWTMVIVRSLAGQPVLPCARRRPVPWQVTHVVVIAAIYMVLSVLIPWIDVRLFKLPVGGATAGNPGSPNSEHLLVVLLTQSHTLGTLALCFVSAVIVAPIVEEFLFRLVLQGWLEALERHARRRIPGLRRITPGLLPIVLVSLLFAGMHYRPPAMQPDPYVIAHLMASNAVAGLLVMALGIGILRRDAGAGADDLGLAPRRLLSDVRLGVLAFLGFALVIYALQGMLSTRYGENVADPLVLFLFALVLGTLYFRTHRIVPSIVLHISLNLTSLTMAWFGAGT